MATNRQQGALPAGHVDMRDPVAVAIKITELDGKNELLAQKVGDGFKTQFDMIANLQGALHEVETLAREIHSRQHQIAEHSTGLERLGTTIEKYIQQQDTRWEKHESENKTVSDRVTLWRGVVIAGVLLVGSVVGLAGYIVKSGFDDAAKARGMIEGRLDRLEARP